MNFRIIKMLGFMALEKILKIVGEKMSKKSS